MGIIELIHSDSDARQPEILSCAMQNTKDTASCEDARIQSVCRRYAGHCLLSRTIQESTGVSVFDFTSQEVNCNHEVGVG